MVASLWLAAAAVLAALLYLFTRSTITLEERERRRRLAVNVAGRITDGLITEINIERTAGGAVVHTAHFSYALGGVTYSAAQDITALLAYIDVDPRRLAGPTSVKYVPGNPSNSIVICEEWSGLRKA